MKKIACKNSGLRNVLMGCMVAFMMFSCTTEDEIFEEAAPAAPETVEVVEEADVASVTLIGIYTEFSENVDCATCSYTVPANVKTVDGAELGIKPGNVVCIPAGRKAGEIEFINMVGTEQQPIIIGNCEE